MSTVLKVKYFWNKILSWLNECRIKLVTWTCFLSFRLSLFGAGGSSAACSIFLLLSNSTKAACLFRNESISNFNNYHILLIFQYHLTAVILKLNCWTHCQINPDIVTSMKQTKDTFRFWSEITSIIWTKLSCDIFFIL